MAAEDEERLIVLVEARLRDLEKNMAKAVGVTTKSYREMSLGSKRATKNMEQDMIRSTTRINQALAATSTKIGAYGKAMIGGFVGGIVAGGLAGVISQVREVANSVAEIGDQARMAGLSTKVFQEWKFVAEQARIPIDAITDGMKELQLRADEFAVTGKGSAAEAFARLGLTPQEVKERLKDPSELMLLIIERTRQMKDTAAGIRIFDELFGGTGGERMVSLLEQGEDAIRDQIRAANELGLVMDKEMIEKAAELDRKFNIVARTVGSSLKGAIMEAVAIMMEFIGIFNGFEARRDSTLNESVSKLASQVLETDTKLTELRSKRDRGELGAGDGGWFGIGESTVSEAIADLERKKEAAETEIGMINEIVAARKKTREVAPVENTGGWKPAEYTPPPAGSGKSKGGGGGSSKKTFDDRLSEDIQAIHDRIAAMKDEQEILGLSYQEQEKRRIALDLEQQALKDLREEARRKGEQDWQNKQLSEAQRAAIDEVSEAYAKQADQLRNATEAMDLQRDVLKGALGDVRSAFEDGKFSMEDFKNVALNALDKIIDKIEDDLVDSLLSLSKANGGGGNFLSSIFSLFTGGGAKVDPWAGMRAPSFEGGGGTGNGPRSGGLDGKGGFPALLHPKESVIDHTKGGAAPEIRYIEVPYVAETTTSDNGELIHRFRRISDEQINAAGPKIVGQSVAAVGKRARQTKSYLGR